MVSRPPVQNSQIQSRLPPFGGNFQHVVLVGSNRAIANGVCSFDQLRNDLLQLVEGGRCATGQTSRRHSQSHGSTRRGQHAENYLRRAEGGFGFASFGPAGARPSRKQSKFSRSENFGDLEK